MAREVQRPRPDGGRRAHAEYGYEKQLSNLQAAAVKRFGIIYPVAQDNGYRIWNAYGNRYWPALYLIDQEDGRIV